MRARGRSPRAHCEKCNDSFIKFPQIDLKDRGDLEIKSDAVRQTDEHSECREPRVLPSDVIASTLQTSTALGSRGTVNRPPLTLVGAKAKAKAADEAVEAHARPPAPAPGPRPPPPAPAPAYEQPVTTDRELLVSSAVIDSQLCGAALQGRQEERGPGRPGGPGGLWEGRVDRNNTIGALAG